MESIIKCINERQTNKLTAKCCNKTAAFPTYSVMYLRQILGSKSRNEKNSPPFIGTIHHSACILNEVVYILSEIVVNSTPHSKKASALRISTHQPKKGRKKEANTHTHTRKTENFSHSEFLICNGIAWEYLYVVEIYSKFVMVRAFLFRTVCTKKWKRNGNERNGVDRMVNKLKMGFHKFTHTHTQVRKLYKIIHLLRI